MQVWSFLLQRALDLLLPVRRKSSFGMIFWADRPFAWNPGVVRSVDALRAGSAYLQEKLQHLPFPFTGLDHAQF